MIQRIRKARERVADLYAKSYAAQPGEVWTVRYAGPDFKGNPFESFIAGEVRILGEECPVEQYRGAKTLGEEALDMEYLPPWRWLQRAFLSAEALHGRQRLLAPGDWAPDMGEQDPDNLGELLAALDNGTLVTVEYRDPHPVYAGLRNVVVGTAYSHDVRGDEYGRDVGDDWVPFHQVTGVLLHDPAEVPS